MQPGVFLTAEWRHLAMLNYAVDPEALRPLTPAGTELDAWQGRTFVSLVAFMFLRTRLLGIPVPFHCNFEEVNLRFYVRRKDPAVGHGQWRRGVVFIKEIVPRLAVALVARVVYNENYSAMPMRHALELENGRVKPGGSARYGWRWRGRWNELSVVARGTPEPPPAGSEAEFITEHYWGYTAQRGGGCAEYAVEHPPWRVCQAGQSMLDCDAEALYGRQWGKFLSGEPTSAFLAEGSPVAVRRGVRIA